ncbi:hypothetical protein [Streptomyces sp. NPDC057910]|uniref:hypothetical protein n=1 Tax=Streptomyces sp. NPDC057910 TaxID=3346278 RepID=UPI0036E7AF75
MLKAAFPGVAAVDANLLTSVVHAGLVDDVGVRRPGPVDRGPPELTEVSRGALPAHFHERDAAGAEAAASSALELLRAQPGEQRPLLVSTQASVDLARARLLRRELDGAYEALVPVFDVPVEWRGAGTLERLDAARRELCHPDFQTASAAADLGEQIEDFTATAAAHKLSASAPLAIEC